MKQIVAAFLTFLCIAPPGQASVTYSVTERLPAISGGKQVEAITAIANDGSAVGNINDSRFVGAPTHENVYWTSPTQAVLLKQLNTPQEGLDDTFAYAINNVGGACGDGFLANGLRRALYWQTHTSVPIPLLPIGLANSSKGYAICQGLNQHGILVGYSTTASGDLHATKWIANTAVDMVPDAPRGSFSEAVAINSLNLVAGYIDDQGVLWGFTGVTPLGSLGGVEAHPTAINDSTQIVGTSRTAQGIDHAFLWQAGNMVDLGTLPGGAVSSAWSINRWGDIVGESESAGDGSHAVLWRNGEMIDLQELLRSQLPANTHLDASHSIADSGRFEVDGFTPNKDVSYLVTPHYSTTITLTSSEPVSLSGDKVTFHVNVRTDDARGTPTGTVIINDGPNNIGSVALDTNGNASLSTSRLAVGTHTIYVLYADNDVYSGGVTHISQQVRFKLIPIPPQAAANRARSLIE